MYHVNVKKKSVLNPVNKTSHHNTLFRLKRILTNAGVKAGMCFEDIISSKVDSIAGEVQVAAERCFWMQLRNGFSLSRGAGSCKTKEHEH